MKILKLSKKTETYFFLKLAYFREVARRKNPLKMQPGFFRVLTQLRVDVIFLRAIDKKKL